MVEVRRCSSGEILAQAEASGLLAEYAAESAINGLPAPAPHHSLYATLEQAGALYPLGAYLDGELVGFLVLLVSMNPHYSAPLAVSESFFVAKQHRSTGAGLRLLHRAEEIARELGAVGLLIPAPLGSQLSRVLDAFADYRETNRVFFKALA